MTLKLLRIDNQLQCIVVGLTFTGTKDFIVTTHSSDNDQIKTFVCSPKSAHYPLIEILLKNPPPNHIKSQNGKLKTTVAKRQFFSRRLSVWKRRTYYLNVSFRAINLTVAHKHTT